MDFDYYFKKYDEEYGFNDSELCGFEIGFEAGQQSKQEGVNKLQDEIDEITKQNQKLYIRVANLEMQIRDAINAFDNLHSESLKDDVLDIIKPFISGENNE